MTEDPELRIIDELPSGLIRDLGEAADTAFAFAHRTAERTAAPPERDQLRAQLRHARLEAEFRQAAAEHRVQTACERTQPPGGRYSLIMTESVVLIRGNVQATCGTPRRTAFRRQFAEVNRYLSATPLELFRDVPTPPRDWLCVMLVVTAPPRCMDQSVPGFVGFGVPHHDLRTWMRLIPISDLMMRYHDVARPVPAEPEVAFKDSAHPRLKGDNSA
jgi:hypothetical protein